MSKILTIYLFNKKQNSILIVLAVISLILMLLRVKITHDIYLLFLLWNLFLGYIPYAFSSKIRTTVPGTFQFYLLFVGWLLFLPNSFYLITDFVHLHHNTTLQFAFDALLFSSFTVAGFYSGIASVFHMHRLSQMKYSIQTSWILVIVVCYLSSFGIYLGRILRFNSWDVLSNPIDLFKNILKSFQNPEAQFFTLILGSFILIVYSICTLFLIRKTPKSW